MQKLYTQKRIRHNPTENLEPSKTDQSFKDDCDVNVILSRYMRTGLSPFKNEGKGGYADVSEVPDLLTAHTQLKEAKAIFDQLPAQVRKKLENNPLALQSYLDDPDNFDEALELGLIVKKEAHPPKKNPEKTVKTKTKNENTPTPEKTKTKTDEVD